MVIINYCFPYGRKGAISRGARREKWLVIIELAPFDLAREMVLIARARVRERALASRIASPAAHVYRFRKSRSYRAFCKLNRHYRAIRALLDKADDAFINSQRAVLRRAMIRERSRLGNAADSNTRARDNGPAMTKTRRRGYSRGRPWARDFAGGNRDIRPTAAFTSISRPSCSLLSLNYTSRISRSGISLETRREGPVFSKCNNENTCIRFRVRHDTESDSLLNVE